MRLSLSPLLGVILCKGRLIGNKRKAAVHQGISELRRTMLDHMAGVFRLAGLVIPRFQPSEGKHFGRAVELAEVAKFGKDDGGGKITDAGKLLWSESPQNSQAVVT